MRKHFSNILVFIAPLVFFIVIFPIYRNRDLVLYLNWILMLFQPIYSVIISGHYIINKRVDYELCALLCVFVQIFSTTVHLFYSAALTDYKLTYDYGTAVLVGVAYVLPLFLYIVGVGFIMLYKDSLDHPE